MSALKNYIGINCPDCNHTIKVCRPDKAGIYKLKCPKCQKILCVKIPNLSGKEIISKEEYTMTNKKN